MDYDKLPKKYYVGHHIAEDMKALSRFGKAEIFRGRDDDGNISYLLRVHYDPSVMPYCEQAVVPSVVVKKVLDKFNDSVWSQCLMEDHTETS